MVEAKLLKIGEFAKRADVSLRTLRYYEELGLIEPSARTKGGFRYYRSADFHRLRLIRDLQELGLTLDRIGDLLTTPDPGQDRAGFLARVRDALAEQDRLVVEQVTALEAQRERIGEGLRKLEQCQTCEHHPSADNNHCEPCGLTGMHLPEVLRGLF